MGSGGPHSHFCGGFLKYLALKKIPPKFSSMRVDATPTRDVCVLLGGRGQRNSKERTELRSVFPGTFPSKERADSSLYGAVSSSVSARRGRPFSCDHQPVSI